MAQSSTSSIICVSDASPISSTTPGTVEIKQHLDDQWIPQDTDAHFTFDLLEPANKGQLEDNPEGKDIAMREDGIKGTVEDRLESPSQKPSHKPTLFARPVSSHMDLSSGFSFTKPKPAQPLNLGNKTNPTAPAALQRITRAPNPESSSDQESHVTQPAQGSDGFNKASKDDGQNPQKIDEKATKRILAVPFPFVLGPTAKGDPHLHSKSESSAPCQTSMTSKHQDNSQLGKRTPFSSSENTMTDATVIEHRATSSNTRKVECISSVDRASPPCDFRGRSSTANDEKQAGNDPRSYARMPSWLKSQDDVIHMLMFNRQRHSQEFQRMAKIQESQKKQVAELLIIKDEHDRELQHVYKRLEEKEMESRGREELKNKVQARLRKFTEFINNLSENHSQLRDTGYRIADEAEELRTEYKRIQVDLQDTKDAMSVTQEAIKRERASSTIDLFRADGQAKLLEQRVQHLQENLQQEQAISHDTEAHSHRLEESINQVSNGCGQLMSAFKDHDDKISKHMTRVIDESIRQSSSNTAVIDPMPMLGKCVQYLEALKDRDTLQPADMDRFETFAKGETSAILGSIRSWESAVLVQLNGSQRTAQQMDSTLKGEIQQLSSVIAAGQPRYEQMTELRETKAALETRLKVAELALTDARMESALLKSREDGTSQRIAGLEHQISQMQIPPETYLRLHDLEIHNKDLTQRSTQLEVEATAVADQLQRKNLDLETANVQLSSLQLQLEEAQARQVTVLEQQSSHQEQLAVQRRQITEELSHISSLGEKKLREELTNTQRQLEQVRNSAKVSLSQTLEQVNVQSAKNAKLGKDLAQEKRRVEAVDVELCKERQQKSLLEEKVISLEQDVRDVLRKQNDKDKEIINLKAKLGQPGMSQQSANQEFLSKTNYPESFVIEESQIEEIPRDEEDFAEYWGNYLNDEAPLTMQPQTPLNGSKPVSEETMRKLLISTPEGPCNVMNGPGNHSVDRQLTVFQRPREILEVCQVEDSQSENPQGPVMMSHKPGNQHVALAASNGPSDAHSSRAEMALDDVTARNTANNAQGPKSNTKIARKRNVTIADLADPDEPKGAKKMTRSSSRMKGSIVIADSQPSGRVSAQTNRPAKLSASTTTQKKGPRTGLYQKEFDKHLRP